MPLLCHCKRWFVGFVFFPVFFEFNLILDIVFLFFLLFCHKARGRSLTDICCRLTQALFWTFLFPRATPHARSLTHTRLVSGRRLISTISANCDAAFCALAVIITDFANLHSALPFSRLFALIHLQPVFQQLVTPPDDFIHGVLLLLPVTQSIIRSTNQSSYRFIN